jgi:hypothetical protein
MDGGGYWPGPSPDINSKMTKDVAVKAVEKGFSQGPLWKYCSAFGAYHCPGDMRHKLRKPGAHWAYDSYSKAGCRWTPQAGQRNPKSETRNPKQIPNSKQKKRR